MGTCTCQIHFHGDQTEFANSTEPPEVTVNIPKDLNSKISSNSRFDKLQKKQIIPLESNIEKKLTEFGHFIKIEQFHKYIGTVILKLIELKQFNYQQYISPPISINKQLNPFQFNDTNDIYHGSWNEEGEMEGKGIFYSFNKKIIIEGIWSKGENICGRIFFPNKEIYEGAISNSKPNGKGELLTGIRDRYIGEFKNGEFIYGQIIFSDDNTKYEGNIESGNFTGQGKMTWINNIEYQGNFENSMLSGKGRIIKIIDINKKEIYEGDFYQNEFNGKGKYFFVNGDIYEGDFENGIKKGYGIYHRNNGDKIIYEGNWSDDYPNGNGTITYGKYKLTGFWRNGDYISSSGEENEIFKNFDKDLKPQKMTIFPTSLPHLNIVSSNNISQYIPENFT